MTDTNRVHAIIEKPVKYIENYWGQEIRVDRGKVDVEKEMEWWPKFGHDRMNVGSLPYTTSPRYRRNMSNRMISEDTRLTFSRACWNECLNQSGPWYNRYWQIWDYVPFVPSYGDITKDPKIGIYTKSFTESYRIERPGVSDGHAAYGIGGRNVPL